jgi:hypothetical protein
MYMRNSIPPEGQPEMKNKFEGGEQSWDESGDDVPDWWIAATIATAGALAALVLGMVLGLQPENQEPAPAHRATPSTYGPPRGFGGPN